MGARQETTDAEIKSGFEAIMVAEGVTPATEEETLAAWQYLVDSGLAWTLQGHFGRQAAGMLELGQILPYPRHPVPQRLDAMDSLAAERAEAEEIDPDFDANEASDIAYRADMKAAGRGHLLGG